MKKYMAKITYFDFIIMRKIKGGIQIKNQSVSNQTVINKT